MSNGPKKHNLTADELDSIAESELAKHPAASRIVRNVATMLRSATKTMTGTEAANKVLEYRDETVMSKYVTQAECRAARDALWNAAEILRATDSGKGLTA